MPQGAAAAQPDDDLARIVTRKGRGRVGFVMHALRQGENVGIAERVVFEFVERELAAP